MTVQVIVSGAFGRMGPKVVQAVMDNDQLRLAAVLERPDHPRLGREVGGFKVASAFEPALARQAGGRRAVLIDFTQPEASLAYAAMAVKAGLAMVVGTTGFSPSEFAELKSAARQIPLVWAPNMSLGVNLMYKIVARMAEALGQDYDLEIVETHHRLKKDAPSGTALKLYQTLAAARNLPADSAAVYGRQGLVGERGPGEIGVLAVRGGDIVGDHTVHFCGPGERLEVTHRAQTRDTFARGAARAAAWVADRAPGLYDLTDVLGL